MLAYFIRRTLQFIPTIIGVTLIIFLLLNVLPGNAALMAGGRQELGAQAIKELKEKKVVVSATVSAHGELCAKGEVVAVRMPKHMLP